MKTALLLALGVLFLVAPTPYAQEDEDLDAELDASGAAGGMPPQMNEEQMKQQQMIMRHIFETVTESCRNEINLVVQLPPEEQQHKVRRSVFLRLFVLRNFEHFLPSPPSAPLRRSVRSAARKSMRRLRT